MSGGPGSRANTNRLLLVLMGVVPLVVLLTVVVAFLLTRAGFGLLVGAGVPFVAGTIFVIGLSVVLGRAASGPGSQEDEDRGGSGDRDGV